MQRPIDRGTLVLVACILAAVVSTRWLRLNVSPSAPYGLYRLAPVPAELAPGLLVVLPVPASVQGVWSRWLPLLKPIAGPPGAVICVCDDALWIADEAYGPVLHEVHGHRLPCLTGCLIVPPGHVFVASRVPGSLDSRYFGPVPVQDLTAQAVPLVTW